MEILPEINSPTDLKKLSLSELQQLCEELRNYIIDTVSTTGGHLAPSLGVVELTVALHYVMNTPEDRLIWDVGHQAYGHKILTGRRDSFPTIRQLGGLSGFCKREESEYDPFGAGHASTSISAAVGIARARDILGKDFRVIAVIGDGALTGGLAYEGLNNAGELKSQLLVILNDNEMSISPNVGAISKYLTRMVTNPLYNRLRDEVWKALGKIPKGEELFRPVAKRIEESVKTFLTPGILFEQLGFRYFGPIYGHNLPEIIEILKRVKDIPVPVILHIITRKGKGLESAEKNPTKYHGISPVKDKTEASHQEGRTETPSYNAIFGQIAIKLAEKYPNIHFISAAMIEGTGLTPLAEKYPDRITDVGIAEGHAVTYAAGLAVEGIRPIVAIYSTFLQRAYDQIFHDVALQKLPVIFALDRAGLVGQDGPTHHGVLDLTYMRSIPGMIIAAPSNGNELFDLLETAIQQNNNPFAIRYPKEPAPEYDENYLPETLPIGKWKILQEGKDLAILATGSLVYRTKEALSALNYHPLLINALYIKPLDTELLDQIADKYSTIVTIEENTLVGGFGAAVLEYFQKKGKAPNLIRLGLPDDFVEHGTREELLKITGLDASGIRNSLLEIYRSLAEEKK